ncbi:hypothetical protein [Streptomonospora salina]|uniref:Uncharacterized protein n=1 Tax=Streptomonospora salina TaxID=104205 RepID=A0A841E1K1_9ACTN|nr:hypothetical protein [Streptomonospora salina]MBB5996572.1 hypothetical protein [Streptomonospora salina]
MIAIPDAQLGPGGHDPHGYLNHRFGATWHITCEPTPGGWYWTATRRWPAPADATAHGVCDRHAGWIRPAELWTWLEEQETAWQHWHDTQHPN